MVAAMMFPLASGAMHAVAARSLWRRRHAAIAWWLAGYTAPWLAVGLALSTVLSALGYSQAMPRWAVVIAFTVAAIWQVTPRRERALRQCHRVVPLAPNGWRANRDCIRYGWTIGVPCVAACGPLMVACSLVGHNPFGLAAMVAATIAGLAERYMTRPDPRWFAAAFTAQAMLVAVSVP
jgi:hypothetical protein